MPVKTALLLLLILLQLPSCNKRYAHLRKIRVPYTSEKEITKAESKKNVNSETIETAAADSTIHLIETPPGYLSEEPTILHDKHPSKKSHNIGRPSNDTKKQYHPPKPYDQPHTKLNKQALTSFIFSVLTLAAVVLFIVAPVASVIFAFLFGIMALSAGSHAYDRSKQTNEKGTWMAIVGIVIGSAIVSIAIVVTLAAFVTAIFNLEAPGGAVNTILREFILVPIAIFLLLIYSRLFAKKKKKLPEPIPPDPEKQQQQKQLVPGKMNKYAVLSFILFYIGIVSLILLAITLFPIFTLIAVLALPLSIIFGVVGYYQIRKYAQTGEWFALIPVLTAATIAAIGFLYITILLFLIWLLSRHLKKRKLKKENKVSLS